MKTIDVKTLGQFRFFREHAGYRVGYNAAGALALTRAENWYLNNETEYKWEDDPEPWGDFFVDAEHNDDYVPHTIEGCVLQMTETCSLGFKHTIVLASLWGIADADDNYRRVVEAEMALEAMDGHT